MPGNFDISRFIPGSRAPGAATSADNAAPSGAGPTAGVQGERRSGESTPSASTQASGALASRPAGAALAQPRVYQDAAAARPLGRTEPLMPGAQVFSNTASFLADEDLAHLAQASRGYAIAVGSERDRRQPRQIFNAFDGNHAPMEVLFRNLIALRTRHADADVMARLVAQPWRPWAAGGLQSLLWQLDPVVAALGGSHGLAASFLPARGAALLECFDFLQRLSTQLRIEGVRLRHDVRASEAVSEVFGITYEERGQELGFRLDDLLPATLLGRVHRLTIDPSPPEHAMRAIHDAVSGVRAVRACYLETSSHLNAYRAVPLKALLKERDYLLGAAHLSLTEALPALKAVLLAPNPPMALTEEMLGALARRVEFDVIFDPSCIRGRWTLEVRASVRVHESELTAPSKKNTQLVGPNSLLQIKFIFKSDTEGVKAKVTMEVTHSGVKLPEKEPPAGDV